MSHHLWVGFCASVPLVPFLIYFAYIQIWAMKVTRQAEKQSLLIAAADLARRVLKIADVHGITVEKGDNHSESGFDLERKKIFLSPKVYDETNFLSVGTVLEKAGHAILGFHNEKTLAVWKTTMIACTTGFWIVAFLLPAGLIVASIPTIVAGYVLLFTAFGLRLFCASIETQMHENVLKQLDKIDGVGQTNIAEIRQVLKALAVLW